MVEMVDFFPTLVELIDAPALPKCAGLNDPPTALCLDGESYASEFFPQTLLAPPAKAKTCAFSQWPQPPGDPSLGVPFYRMGYTVRSDDGYRLTECVITPSPG